MRRVCFTFQPPEAKASGAPAPPPQRFWVLQEGIEGVVDYAVRSTDTHPPSDGWLPCSMSSDAAVEGGEDGSGTGTISVLSEDASIYNLEKSALVAGDKTQRSRRWQTKMSYLGAFVVLILFALYVQTTTAFAQEQDPGGKPSGGSSVKRGNEYAGWFVMGVLVWVEIALFFQSFIGVTTEPRLVVLLEVLSRALMIVSGAEYWFMGTCGVYLMFGLLFGYHAVDRYYPIKGMKEVVREQLSDVLPQWMFSSGGGTAAHSNVFLNSALLQGAVLKPLESLDRLLRIATLGKLGGFSARSPQGVLVYVTLVFAGAIGFIGWEGRPPIKLDFITLYNTTSGREEPVEVERFVVGVWAVCLVIIGTTFLGYARSRRFYGVRRNACLPWMVAQWASAFIFSVEGFVAGLWFGGLRFPSLVIILAILPLGLLIADWGFAQFALNDFTLLYDPFAPPAGARRRRAKQRRRERRRALKEKKAKREAEGGAAEMEVDAVGSQGMVGGSDDVAEDTDDGDDWEDVTIDEADKEEDNGPLVTFTPPPSCRVLLHRLLTRDLGFLVSVSMIFGLVVLGAVLCYKFSVALDPAESFLGMGLVMLGLTTWGGLTKYYNTLRFPTWFALCGGGWLAFSGAFLYESLSCSFKLEGYGTSNGMCTGSNFVSNATTSNGTAAATTTNMLLSGSNYLAAAGGGYSTVSGVGTAGTVGVVAAKNGSGTGGVNVLCSGITPTVPELVFVIREIVVVMWVCGFPVALLLGTTVVSVIRNGWTLSRRELASVVCANVIEFGFLVYVCVQACVPLLVPVMAVFLLQVFFTLVALKWLFNRFRLPRSWKRATILVVALLVVGYAFAVFSGLAELRTAFASSVIIVVTILFLSAMPLLSSHSVHFSSTIFPVHDFNSQTEAVTRRNSELLAVYGALFILIVWGAAMTVYLREEWVGVMVAGLASVGLFTFTLDQLFRTRVRFWQAWTRMKHFPELLDELRAQTIAAASLAPTPPAPPDGDEEGDKKKTVQVSPARDSDLEDITDGGSSSAASAGAFITYRQCLKQNPTMPTNMPAPFGWLYRKTVKALEAAEHLVMDGDLGEVKDLLSGKDGNDRSVADPSDAALAAKLSLSSAGSRGSRGGGESKGQDRTAAVISAAVAEAEAVALLAYDAKLWRRALADQQVIVTGAGCTEANGVYIASRQTPYRYDRMDGDHEAFYCIERVRRSGQVWTKDTKKAKDAKKGDGIFWVVACHPPAHLAAAPSSSSSSPSSSTSSSPSSRQGVTYLYAVRVDISIIRNIPEGMFVEPEDIVVTPVDPDVKYGKEWPPVDGWMRCGHPNGGRLAGGAPRVVGTHVDRWMDIPTVMSGIRGWYESMAQLNGDEHRMVVLFEMLVIKCYDQQGVQEEAVLWEFVKPLLILEKITEQINGHVNDALALDRLFLGAIGAARGRKEKKQRGPSRAKLLSWAQWVHTQIDFLTSAQKKINAFARSGGNQQTRGLDVAMYVARRLLFLRGLEDSLVQCSSYNPLSESTDVINPLIALSQTLSSGSSNGGSARGSVEVGGSRPGSTSEGGAAAADRVVVTGARYSSTDFGGSPVGGETKIDVQDGVPPSVAEEDEDDLVLPPLRAQPRMRSAASRIRSTATKGDGEDGEEGGDAASRLAEIANLSELSPAHLWDWTRKCCVPNGQICPTCLHNNIPERRGVGKVRVEGGVMTVHGGQGGQGGQGVQFGVDILEGDEIMLRNVPALGNVTLRVAEASVDSDEARVETISEEGASSSSSESIDTGPSPVSYRIQRGRPGEHRRELRRTGELFALLQQADRHSQREERFAEEQSRDRRVAAMQGEGAQPTRVCNFGAEIDARLTEAVACAANPDEVFVREVAAIVAQQRRPQRVGNGEVKVEQRKWRDKQFDLGQCKETVMSSTDIDAEMRVFVEGVDPADVRQGACQDCWLLSAMSILAANSQKVAQLDTGAGGVNNDGAGGEAGAAGGGRRVSGVVHGEGDSIDGRLGVSGEAPSLTPLGLVRSTSKNHTVSPVRQSFDDEGRDSGERLDIDMNQAEEEAREAKGEMRGVGETKEGAKDESSESKEGRVGQEEGDGAAVDSAGCGQLVRAVEDLIMEPRVRYGIKEGADKAHITRNARNSSISRMLSFSH